MNNNNTRDWLLQFFSHFWTHIFVIATGIAALTHSTWTLATLFGGREPAFGPHWFGWITPAFLVAFAFDIGQIAISADLRRGERTRFKYITFVALACATYYMQWWYLVAHIPAIPLSEGVAPEMQGAVTVLRSIAIWVVPALLPMSTTLYTFSYAAPKRTASRPAKAGDASTTQTAIVPANRANVPATDIVVEMPQSYFAECDLCGWQHTYTSKRSATNALVAHKRHNH